MNKSCAEWCLFLGADVSVFITNLGNSPNLIILLEFFLSLLTSVSD